MQKNKIIIILAIGIIFSPVFIINAEVVPTATTSTNTTPINPTIDKAKMEELKAKLMKETEIIRKNIGTSKTEIEKSILSIKNQVIKKLSVATQEKVRTILDNIFNKMNTQIAKLLQVDIKILAKINSLDKNDVNLTGAKAQYNIAKAALDKANADTLAARTVSSNQIITGTSKETLRTLVKTSEENIKKAGAEYMKIIPIISKTNNN